MRSFSLPILTFNAFQAPLAVLTIVTGTCIGVHQFYANILALVNINLFLHINAQFALQNVDIFSYFIDQFALQHVNLTKRGAFLFLSLLCAMKMKNTKMKYQCIISFQERRN